MTSKANISPAMGVVPTLPFVKTIRSKHFLWSCTALFVSVFFLSCSSPSNKDQAADSTVAIHDSATIVHDQAIPAELSVHEYSDTILHIRNSPSIIEIDSLKNLIETTDVSTAQLYLVVDDLGNRWNTPAVQGFLTIDIPLTVAVLPHYRASRRIAETASQNGKDVLVHLPMEPATEVSGMESEYLHSRMTAEEVEQYITAAAESVPCAIGANNHMGSGATTDSSLMNLFVHSCMNRNWIVFDSVTHPRSILYSMANNAGVPAVKRDIFLDHIDDPLAIQYTLYRAVLRSVERERPLFIICHPRRNTWEVLHNEVGWLTEQSVHWMKLSDFFDPGLSEWGGNTDESIH